MLLCSLLPGLAACGSSAPPAPLPAAETTAAAADTYDGYYTGTRTVTAVKGSLRCGQEFDEAAIRVTHGVAILRLIGYHHPVVFRAQLAPDGTFMMTFKGNMLDGHFSGDVFEGSVDTKSCTYQVHASRTAQPGA